MQRRSDLPRLLAGVIEYWEMYHLRSVAPEVAVLELADVRILRSFVEAV
jgi:hypothetical protein